MEMAENDGSVATHAFCARCSQVEPVVFTHITIVEVGGLHKREFVGLGVKCQTCGFKITRIGTLGPVLKMAV